MPTTAGRDTNSRATSRVAPVLRDAAGIDAAEREPGLLERLGLAEQQHAVAGREAGLRVGQLVRAALPDGDELHAGRQPGDQLGDGGAARVAEGDLERLQRRGRGREPRLEERARRRRGRGSGR